jgi:hypothetical protein
MAPAVSKDDRASHAVPDLLHAAYPAKGKPRREPARTPDDAADVRSTKASCASGRSPRPRRIPCLDASWRPARISGRTIARAPARPATPALDRPVFVMSLSPREQNILEDIESQLRGEDPALARQLTRAPGRERARGGTRMLVLTAVSIVVGVGLMILAAVLDSPILMVAAVSFLVVVPTLTGLSYFVGRE